jgi:hypothetical protein
MAASPVWSVFFITVAAFALVAGLEGVPRPIGAVPRAGGTGVKRLPPPPLPATESDGRAVIPAHLSQVRWSESAGTPFGTWEPCRPSAKSSSFFTRALSIVVGKRRSERLFPKNFEISRLRGLVR